MTMPRYVYSCKACDKDFEDSYSIEERNEPTKTPCKHCGGEIYLTIGTTAIGDPIKLGIRKPSEGFRDRLREIKKNHPGSKMNII
jgi:putative FmdB family regulatory protein